MSQLLQVIQQLVYQLLDIVDQQMQITMVHL
jgi:hypothetical protein